MLLFRRRTQRGQHRRMDSVGKTAFRGLHGQGDGGAERGQPLGRRPGSVARDAGQPARAVPRRADRRAGARRPRRTRTDPPHQSAALRSSFNRQSAERIKENTAGIIRFFAYFRNIGCVSDLSENKFFVLSPDFPYI